MSRDAFICDAVRTPIGRFGGALAGCAPTISPRMPIRALMERNPSVDWAAVDEVIFGCANQAGEDNRNVARMALLLAGLPTACPARPSTGSAARAWTRSAPPRARSGPARRTSSSPAASRS